jgi:penicillin amidase
MLLEPRVGRDWEDYKWWMSGVFLENTVLLEKEAWLPMKDFGNYEALLAAAVEETLKDAPRELDSWTWGKVSTIQVKHFVFAGIPLLSRVSSTEVLAQSGSGDTVKQVGKRFGPSERLTVDFSNLDKSTLNIVNGQSGHISSQYYNDQWKAWYDGTTYSLPFSRQAVDKAAVNRLTLSPAK